ncbi:MAG: serine/threonine protein phosphatase [Deltaproteobacteria bacterium]|jgi:serine/threonine protein phosphatase PrpC|nr:serine/threonine protein phosphatase [Deltaproteobacteria bacterium]
MEDVEQLSVAFGEALFFTTACPGREVNEDAIGVFPLGEGRAVLAVADGVGGQPAGESASRRTLECLWDALLAAPDSEESLRTPILDGIEAGNRALLEAGHGAAATLAVAELRGRELRSYHVGDAAILLVGQRGRVKLQTVAHSPVGYAVEAGLLDPEDALHHEERHLISNAVGAPDMRIEIGSRLVLGRRDTLLLATDGLFDNVHQGELNETIRTGALEKAGRSLPATCRARMEAAAPGLPSKPDDLAFVLFRPGR